MHDSTGPTPEQRVPAGWRRRLAGVLSVLSAVLCVGAAAAWAVSYRIEVFGWSPVEYGGTQFEFKSRVGSLYCEYKTNCLWDMGRTVYYKKMDVNYRRISTPDWIDAPSVLGFAVSARTWSPPRHWRPVDPDPVVRTYGVVTPYWFICLLTAATPALWVARVYRRRRRRMLGRCAACGYDLRASAGACPECGEPAR